MGFTVRPHIYGVVVVWSRFSLVYKTAYHNVAPFVLSVMRRGNILGKLLLSSPWCCASHNLRGTHHSGKIGLVSLCADYYSSLTTTISPPSLLPVCDSDPLAPPQSSNRNTVQHFQNGKRVTQQNISLREPRESHSCQ